MNSAAVAVNHYANWMLYSALMVLCYWPTYFMPSVAPPIMQKSFFFVMLGYLGFVMLATKARVYLPKAAFVFMLPLAAMFCSFLFNIEHFSFFHISVLVKPFLLFLLVCLFYSALMHTRDHGLQGLLKCIEIILILQIILVALQISFGDVAWLKIMSFRKVYEGLTFRAPGSLDWVYSTCYFLTFFLTVYVIELFFSARKFKAFVLLALTLLVIFLSQSKTGYVATVMVMLYFVVLSLVLRLGITSKLTTVFMFGLGLIVTVLVVFELRMEYVFTFIELLQSGKMDGSTATRTAQTYQAINEGLTYWYRGSPSALEGVIIENTYLDYFFRYGVPGLTAILLIIAVLFVYSFAVTFRARRLLTQGKVQLGVFQLALACHVSFFAVAFYSLSGTPLDAYRSAVWSSFLVALLAYLDYVVRCATRPASGYCDTAVTLEVKH